MTSVRSFTLAMAALLAWTGAARAQEQRVDILRIYENFVASEIAAAKCGATDPALSEGFSANAMAVTIRALETVKERTQLPDDRLKDLFQNNTAKLRQQIVALVERQGCSSADVTTLIKLYRMHATMNLYGKPAD